MKKSIRTATVIFLFFDAIGAIFGGMAFILDPSGKALQIPIEFLEDSPFDNFLIPGIILLTVNGLFNAFVGILGILKKRVFPFLTVLCGLFLTGWLSIQIMIIKQFYAPLHVPYYLIGIALILLGMILRKQLRQKS